MRGASASLDSDSEINNRTCRPIEARARTRRRNIYLLGKRQPISTKDFLEFHWLLTQEDPAIRRVRGAASRPNETNPRPDIRRRQSMRRRIASRSGTEAVRYLDGMKLGWKRRHAAKPRKIRVRRRLAIAKLDFVGGVARMPLCMQPWTCRHIKNNDTWTPKGATGLTPPSFHATTDADCSGSCYDGTEDGTDAQTPGMQIPLACIRWHPSCSLVRRHACFSPSPSQYQRHRWIRGRKRRTGNQMDERRRRDGLNKCPPISDELPFSPLVEPARIRARPPWAILEPRPSTLELGFELS
jgi:hypothetical protein